jgi:hypothetical protein
MEHFMTLVKTPARDGLDAVVSEVEAPEVAASATARRGGLWLWLRVAWRRATASRPFADLGEARRYSRARAIQRSLIRHDPARPRF